MAQHSHIVPSPYLYVHLKPFDSFSLLCFFFLFALIVVAGAWFMKRFFPNAKTSKATGILWMDVLIPMFACVS
jgi:hypothetical protein